MEEEKGSTSSSGSMQSCHTHASSSTEDFAIVQQKPSPGARALQPVLLHGSSALALVHTGVQEPFPAALRRCLLINNAVLAIP